MGLVNVRDVALREFLFVDLNHGQVALETLRVFITACSTSGAEGVETEVLVRPVVAAIHAVGVKLHAVGVPKGLSWTGVGIENEGKVHPLVHQAATGNVGGTEGKPVMQGRLSAKTRA